MSARHGKAAIGISSRRRPFHPDRYFHDLSAGPPLPYSGINRMCRSFFVRSTNKRTIYVR